MTNQELFEAIAPYMPHNVKAMTKLRNIYSVGVGLNLTRGEVSVSDVIYLDGFKLILHPLSDLTEPCLEGGKVPIVEIAKNLFGNAVWAKYDYSITNAEVYCYISSDNVPMPGSVTGFFVNIKNPFLNNYKVIKELYRYHFDIEGLIEKGHAIDINTLSNDLKKL